MTWIVPLPEAPDYWVTDKGKVYSTKKEKIREIQPWPSPRGHLKAEIWEKGKPKRYYIHVLVAKAFLGAPPFEGAMVLHRDGNCRNNHADNLAWGSQSLNERHKRAGEDWDWEQELAQDRATHGCPPAGDGWFVKRPSEEDDWRTLPEPGFEVDPDYGF